MGSANNKGSTVYSILTSVVNILIVLWFSYCIYNNCDNQQKIEYKYNTPESGIHIDGSICRLLHINNHGLRRNVDGTAV